MTAKKSDGAVALGEAYYEFLQPNKLEKAPLNSDTFPPFDYFVIGLTS